MRRLLIAGLVLAAVACGDDGGDTSEGPVDADRMADALDELGYDCDAPEEDHDGSSQVCSEGGRGAMLGFTYTDVEGRDGRLEAEEDQVCAASDEAFVTWAVGENWVAEPTFDITELETHADEIRAETEAAARAVVDELGGEVRVFDHADC